MEIPKHNPLDVVARLTSPAKAGIKRGRVMGAAGVASLTASMPLGTVDTRAAAGAIVLGVTLGAIGAIETHLSVMESIDEMEDAITLEPEQVLDLANFAEESSPAT